MKSVSDYFTGYICIRICGCSCERFLNLCRNHHIDLWNVCCCKEYDLAYMKASDFKKIKKIVRKSHVHIIIEEKYGFPFFIKRHRKRKLFLLGSICCCFFIYIFSLFIWKIEINGNQELTRINVMDYLKKENVGYGTKKSQINCKKIAADLRNQFPVITWVAVEQKGTLLAVTIKENDDKKKVVSNQDRIYHNSESKDIISEYDGTIRKIITRTGTPLVKNGDKVKKGDILVSGILDITNDEGEVINTHMVIPDADIYIEFKGRYQKQISMIYQDILYTGKRKKGFYVKIFGNWFSTMRKTEYYQQQDFVSSEQQLKLFKDLYLPVSWGKIEAREYEIVSKIYSPNEAKRVVTKRLEKFILENKEKGVQIFEKNVKIDTSVTICKCTCDYKALALCRR